MIDGRLLLVLPGERPCRLEVQTFLVALVIVGTSAGRQMSLLQLVLLVLLELGHLVFGAADAASAAATTEATTFKFCLDANAGTEKLHGEHVIFKCV